MKKFVFTISLLALLFLSSCGKNYESQIETKAPKTDLQINKSLIALRIFEKNVSDLMAKNPQAKVRVLGKDTFEFRGLEKKQILKVAPLAIVESNKFINIQSKTINKKQFVNNILSTNPFVKFAPKFCTKNYTLNVPEIKISNALLDDSFHAHQALKLSFKAPLSEILTSWYLIPPMGSNLNIYFNDSKTLHFTPDMPGSYSVALFLKKGDGCNVRFKEFTVTLNSSFIPTLLPRDLSSLNALSKQDFIQISTTNSNKARKLLTGKNKVIVAVLDTGVNYNHPTLKDNMWINTDEIDGDGIDNDSNGYIDDIVGFDFENADAMPMDDSGHGSHVAGLIAGKYIGTGNMPNVKIMALKSGSRRIDVGSVIKGFNYAIDNGANIINMSFGGRNRGKIFENTIKKASDAGILIVAASGNGNPSNGLGMNNDITPFFPASYNSANILSVAACKANGSLTQYSNYGQTQVDIAAVGGYYDRFNKTKKFLKSAHLENPKGLLLKSMFGTSMATPIVSGIASLMLSENPNLSPSDIIDIMMRTGKKSLSLREVITSEAAVDGQAAILFIQNLF